MARRKTNSVEVLAAIADFRLMSATQLSIYFGVKKQATWNNIRKLLSDNLIKEFRKETGRSRGRPEWMYSLTERGVNVLRENGILNQDPGDKFVLAENLGATTEHQLLQNWFRLHLVYADRQNKVLFENIPTNSSLYWQGSGYTNLYYHCRAFTTSKGKEITVIPDLVFRTLDPISGKSLLFFVEIDRGTENLMSPDRKHKNDIFGKICNYLYYWDNNVYKQYEQVWNCTFKGFRVLFVANNTKNSARLCRLVSDLGRYSNFVWVTDMPALFNSGIGGDIWYPGGQMIEPANSILGKLAFECPIANIKYHA